METESRTIRFQINDRFIHMAVPVHRTLLELIRDDIGLTGTKEGCDEGECGACTVLMDGVAIHSCCTLAVHAEGTKIITIEGLQQEEELDLIQRAFVDVGAVQCGFCIPGMILSAKALLDVNQNPTIEEIKTSIEGNICRCTGYDRIVQGIVRAAEYRNELLNN
jgi:Aerobic-type carbon monoxide dehydrogenase, small subunit CoxS/CutS homologs